MKTTIPCIAIISLTACSQAKIPNTKPNIVLIMADDMGYSDIGCFGSEIHTPNIDRLAAEGIIMTNFYNAGRSCPTRASLLTGLYQHQAGVGDMLQDDNLPAYDTHISFNTVTLAEVLKQAGYYCMISGKWHVGNQEAYWPMKRGFDKQYASNGTTGHYFGIAKGRDYIVEDSLRESPGEWIKAGKTSYKLFKNKDGSQWYATDAYTDRAINYIKELRTKDNNKPFFLYLAYTSPHWPLHAFEKDIKKYEGKYMSGWDTIRAQRYKKMIELNIIKDSWQLSDRNENAKNWNDLSDSSKIYYDRLMSVYAAMIDRMDQNIGKLISYLKQTTDYDNTIILFLSDNGGCHEILHRGRTGALTGTPDSFDSYEYSWANVSNTPFKWFKHWSHEGAISTPFIAWYPKMIKAGKMNKQTAHIIDIMPTLCELSGAKYPEIYNGNRIIPEEGISLVPLFKGENFQNHETLFWEHEGNRAVRKGDMKLVSRFDYKNNKELPWELYNLSTDRTEIHNLVNENTKLVKELIQLYDEWSKRVNIIPHKELKEIRKNRKL